MALPRKIVERFENLQPDDAQGLQDPEVILPETHDGQADLGQTIISEEPVISPQEARKAAEENMMALAMQKAGGVYENNAEDTDLRMPDFKELEMMSDEDLVRQIENLKTSFVRYRVMLHKKDPAQHDDIARKKPLQGQDEYVENELIKFRKKIGALEGELAGRKRGQKQSEKPAGLHQKLWRRIRGFMQ